MVGWCEEQFVSVFIGGAYLFVFALLEFMGSNNDAHFEDSVSSASQIFIWLVWISKLNDILNSFSAIVPRGKEGSNKGCSEGIEHMNALVLSERNSSLRGNLEGNRIRGKADGIFSYIPT